MAKAPMTKVGPPDKGTSGMTPPNPPPFAEIGASGLRVFSGYLDEEFLQDLRGVQGRRKFREMMDNDSTVGALLNAITLVLRGVKWTAEPNQDATGDNSSAQAEAEALFAESLFDDMSHTWEDFVAEVMTMLGFGWSYFEIVLKRRVGPLEPDPTKRSKYTDGRIGVRKLAPRAQESLLRWEMQQDGGIAGLWQIAPSTGQINFIPIERALLFRTTSRKNSPEGVSILRTAYKAYYYLNRIQDVEAIGIERELAGLPVVKIPAKYLDANASETDKAVCAIYKQIARDIKFNAQGGLVVPSDMWPTQDNSPSAEPMVSIELLKTGGPRAINTSDVKKGYQNDIARTALAEFIMLGADGRGSYALSKDKTDFFIKACEAYLNGIAAVLNRILLPRVWDLNGIDRALLPTMKPGGIAAADLGVLGAYLQALAAAGAPLFPDDDLEAAVRDAADLPMKSPEAAAAQQAQRDQEAEQAAAAAQAATVKPAATGDATGKQAA